MDFGRLKDLKLQGFGKVVHLAVMGLTYPLRHFFKFLAFLIVFIVIAAAIPMMRGVSYKDIPDWYLLRYEPEAKTDTVVELKQQITPKEENIAEVSAPKIIREEKPMIEETGSGRRQAFKKIEDEQSTAPRRQYPVMKINPADKKPRPAKVVPSEKLISADESPSLGRTAAEVSVPRPEDNVQYRKIDSLPLVYEDNPQNVSGQTFVFSANEMSVGNTYIILYGVYTDPAKYNQEKAHQYVKELVDGKMMTCKIVAYTYNNIATGICFLENMNINKNLVDAGFADNVAL